MMLFDQKKSRPSKVCPFRFRGNGTDLCTHMACWYLVRVPLINLLSTFIKSNYIQFRCLY